MKTNTTHAILILSVLLITSIPSCKMEVTSDVVKQKDDAIHQYSVWQAFYERDYEGEITIKEVKEKGDFGLGTFNGLDGEMVVLDGIVYKIKSDGRAHVANDSELSPLNVVKYFESDTTIALQEETRFDNLKDFISGFLTGMLKPVAIKISGKFKKVKTRTVEKQTKPYPSAQEVITNQIVFEAEDLEGTAVGYWFPDYTGKVNSAGFHFHFLAKEKYVSGHILDCVVSDIKIELDYAGELVVKF